VAFLVENLTNEEVEIKYDENGNEIKQSDEEVIQNYTNHVEEIINKDDDLLLIKLSDFSDNALNLQSVEDVSKRLWLSRKYQPVMEKFVKRISERSSFSVDQKGRILTTLQNAILETEKIISENS
jgi:small-conductance mechanosensitive channel